MVGSISFELALIAVSVILSGFFSSSETALLCLTDLRLHNLVANKKYSDLLALWVKYPNRMLNTVLFGNTLFTVLASVMAGAVAARYVDNYAIILTTVVMTALILTIGEVIPKTIARCHAQSIALLHIRILNVIFYVFYPVSWGMNLIVSFIEKHSSEAVNDSKVLTEDALAYILDVSEEQGVLEDQKQQMLSGVLDISDIYVKEIMTPRTDMLAVPVDISREELLQVIRENEYSRIPVYEDTLDRILGILYVKDLIKLMLTDWDMKDVMSTMHDPLFVPETKRTDDMLKEFQKERQQMAIVVDEYGGVAGVVTMEDVLEEIVGEIWDEYDEEAAGDIVQLGENEYRIEGRTNIDDFCEYFSIERTDDMSDFDTVGGLIYDVAGAIPSPGDTFEWRGFTITIHKMNENKIESVDFIRNTELAAATEEESG